MVTTRSKDYSGKGGENGPNSGDRTSKPKASGREKKPQGTSVPEKSGKKAQIDKILQDHSKSALDTALKDPQQSTPETVLAHLFNALISSARISHNIAAGTVEQLLAAGYHNIETLEKSSWQERTEVLTKGRYRGIGRAAVRANGACYRRVHTLP